MIPKVKMPSRVCRIWDDKNRNCNGPGLVRVGYCRTQGAVQFRAFSDRHEPGCAASSPNRICCYLVAYGKRASVDLPCYPWPFRMGRGRIWGDRNEGQWAKHRSVPGVLYIYHIPSKITLLDWVDAAKERRFLHLGIANATHPRASCPHRGKPTVDRSPRVAHKVTKTKTTTSPPPPPGAVRLPVSVSIWCVSLCNFVHGCGTVS